MQIIPYRDIYGRLFRQVDKPCWFGDSKRHTSGGFILAKLIYCPETDGLRWIGHCEKCELFKGHKRYQGVKCESTKPNNPPAYFRGG